MKCAACGQKMVKKITELDLRIDEKLYLVNNVKLEECQSCGEKVLDPDISEEIFDMVRFHRYQIKSIEMPVLDLAIAQ